MLFCASSTRDESTHRGEAREGDEREIRRPDNGGARTDREQRRVCLVVWTAPPPWLLPLLFAAREAAQG